MAEAHRKELAEHRANLRRSLAVPRAGAGQVRQPVPHGFGLHGLAVAELPAKVTAQGVKKRPVAGGLSHLQAAPLQPQVLRLLPGARLGHQARFADPGLAGEQQHLPCAAPQPSDGVRQDSQFGSTADEPGLQLRDAARFAQRQLSQGQVDVGRLPAGHARGPLTARKLKLLRVWR